MNDSFSKETRSYHDPMAEQIEAAKKHRKAQEAEFPGVVDSYDGFYLRLDSLSAEGNRFFLGATAIIGSRLSFDRENIQLLRDDGVVLAQITGSPAERLAKHLANKWSVNVFLSATYFRSQDKSAVVDLAFICWKPLDAEFEATLQSFSQNLANRFAAGDRAALKLSQDQFIKVLQSKGAWYLTPNTKREPLKKDLVVYKNRRSGTEQATGYALKHRMGCNILASIFWVALIAVIVWLVWYFFFR